MSLPSDFVPKYDIKVQCSKHSTIGDINKDFNYKDEFPNGRTDRNYVACGQENGYNELEEFYESHLASHVASGRLDPTDAIQALCETCHEMKAPRKRKEFITAVGKKLRLQLS